MRNNQRSEKREHINEEAENLHGQLDLYFRAHTVPIKSQEEYRTERHEVEPEHALIFHCANTADHKQDVLFGAYVCAKLEGGQYVAKEIGLFHRDGHPEELRVLKRFVKNSAFELGSVEEFRRKVFLKYLKAGELIVSYDVPLQISRIAVKWHKSKKRRRAFSFYFRMYRDKRTGKVRPSGFEPGLSIESLDATKAVYRLIKYKFHEKDADKDEEQRSSNVHVIDLKTVTAALTGKPHTLSSACEIFGAPASRTRNRHTRITKRAIECLLRDVTRELELLNRLREELARHSLDLPLERLYSSATLAKSCYSEMGLKPPQENFNIPDRINGIALQALAAGRAECTVRKTPVPVSYVDFHAQFPAVSSLLGCREILCAENLEFQDFTAGAREMTERATLEDCFRPEFWEQLRWYALVEPCDDVVPFRAKFAKRDDSDPTLAWDFLTSKQPTWISGPDVIAAKLITGKPIKILEAIQIVPHRVQAGLRPIKLYDKLVVDPRTDDLAVKLVELRTAVKKKNPALAGGLKVAANSAAFGILGQLNVKDLDSPSALQVFSGEANYLTRPAKVWEQPSDYFCPVIASLVTGGSHLLCAMLERAVRDIGGHIAAMDTDSAMIVSTKDGGYVRCAGGPHKLQDYRVPSGLDAIRALSFADVDRLRKRFESLNPWRDSLKTPFLKLEDQNFDSNGNRQQLYAYCVSAKLYCLYNLDGDKLLVRKPSGHGLGYLQAPYSIADWQRRIGRKWEEDLPPWIHEAWHFILSRELGLPHEPPRWLKQPAVMKVPVSTPQVLDRLGSFKDELRPFTTISIPFPKKEPGQLWTGFFIMPYTEKANDLHGRPMVNVVSGATFYIYDRSSSTFPKSSGWLSLRTMEDEIDHLLARTESKFCTPEGGRCKPNTIGLLVRRHITAGEFHYVGKEASTRWGGGLDLSMMAGAGALDPVDETFREYERVFDPKYLEAIRVQAKQFSTKLLSRKAKLAECAIRSFKRGNNTIRPRSLRRLIKALHELKNEYLRN